MIYSLYSLLKPTALKVMHDNQPVSYDGGDIDALHKWIVSMNGKQINKSLGIEGSRKYPLIWLTEGWNGNEFNPGIKFTKVTFYIAINSKVETLNKDRVNNFDVLYKVANDFIKRIKKVGRIEENNISYIEKASFNTEAKSESKESLTLDVWDALILNLDIHIVNTKNCFNN